MWLLLLVALAEARSTGIYISSEVSKGCDFEDPGYISQWGCKTNTWNYTMPYARQYCLDAPSYNGNKFMWWAGAPRLSTNPVLFSMRAGDGNAAFDATTYVPGRFVSIYIRALKFDTTYKGLLLYAKNSTGGKVGDWIVPLEANPQFAAAPDASIMCNRSVMHINAEEKPYVSKFTFVTPPAGTGPITFKCIVKTGPPNPTDYGDFEIVKDLTLQEAAAPTDSKKWVVLPEGQSCTTYCNTVNNGTGEPCSDAALSSSMQGLQPNPLDSIYPCHGAVFQDCTGNPRVALPDNFCTYHPANCPTGASCSMVATAAVPLFCVCGAPVYGISASHRATPGFFATVLAALFVGMWGSKSHMAMATLLLMASALPFAQAHNWLEGTRGRAYQLGANQFCSPTFPQVDRNTIHLQVAAGQDFVVEWAAAHGDFTYYALISDDARVNISKLTRATMDNYLANCPTGGFANDTAQPKKMKYHRFRPDFNLNSTSLVNAQVPTAPMYNDTFLPNFISSGPLWNSFSLNGARPASFFRTDRSLGLEYTGTPCADCVKNFTLGTTPNATLAQYRPKWLLNDRICSYVNASNPWIIAVYRFSHQEVGATLSTALLQFPNNTAPGRYQVIYKWSSYCDVMDADVKSSASPVTAPYGTFVPTTAIEYDVSHHCMFPKPRLVGDCFEVVTGPQQCQAVCSANTNCKGFQLLPLQMDASLGNSLGLFPDQTYVPWVGTGNGYYNENKTFCDKSRFANVKSGGYVCYPIYTFQDDYNSARPLWSLTEDTNHQGFYGTCYIKTRPVSFLSYPNVTVDPLDDFRFGSKCIPCDNIGQDLTNPRWGPQLDFCTDCKAKSVPPRQGPTVPSWTKQANGTFSGAVKWLNPAGTPFAMADECAILASRDPACSKFVMYSDTRASLFSGKTNITLLNANLNSSANFRLYNASMTWHFTNYALTSSYYRSCACFPGNATTLPAVDANSTANACAGVSTMSQCTAKGFEIFQLA